MLFALFIVIQCISLGQVHALACSSPSTPRQFRVAFRGENGVTISWATKGTSGSNDTPNPTVIYGTSSSLAGALTSQTGTTSTYGSSSFFHNVGLFNLTASTKYYYQIVNSTCATQSDIYSFTTAPPVGSLNPVNISLVGDLGINNLVNNGQATVTINALLEAANTTNFFIHSGDISYADDVVPLMPDKTYEEVWNIFQNSIVGLTANNIYMTAPGNHEVTCNQEPGDIYCELFDENIYRNFSAYLNRFRMPGNESGGYQNMWYSFNYGMVHVVVIDTETDFTGAPSGPGTSLNGGNFEGVTQQQAWFEADLQAANANRTQVPWIIVTGHRPFYSSVPNIPATPGNCSTCSAAFEQYILQYNVDFYFCGHVHWYERLYPIDENGNPTAMDYNNQPGPIHVTNGAGGAAEGDASVSSNITASAKIVTGYGYTQLQLLNASYAQLSFINSSSLQVVDTVLINRNH